MLLSNLLGKTKSGLKDAKILMLSVGDKVPNFSLPDQNGVLRSLREFAGKRVIIYFYPKDDTPGCTKEACMIAEAYTDFTKHDVVVLGVSKDTPHSHKKFAEKYMLPFTLLSDTSGEVIEQYGAWDEKRMFGRTFHGIIRMTYLIDKNGLIAKVYPDVDPATHALELLKDVKGK
jgi:peroxiredoxin Q/BCP